jgi:hypothetical protein
VRTLAEGEARYNPIGYHVGTVWPYDNSFIAWGLRRYGFKGEAATPLLFLRTMLGLEPHGEHLVVDPALPREIGHLELLDIPGRWGRIDAFGRGRVDVAEQLRTRR